jgi:hypothetical protein
MSDYGFDKYLEKCRFFSDEVMHMAKKLSKIMLTASVLIAGVVISGKVRANSYYSVENAPEFYGTTKAVIQLGDEFDISL